MATPEFRINGYYWDGIVHIKHVKMASWDKTDEYWMLHMTHKNGGR